MIKIIVISKWKVLIEEEKTKSGGLETWREFGLMIKMEFLMYSLMILLKGLHRKTIG